MNERNIKKGGKKMFGIGYGEGVLVVIGMFGGVL